MYDEEENNIMHTHIKMTRIASWRFKAFPMNETIYSSETNCHRRNKQNQSPKHTGQSNLQKESSYIFENPLKPALNNS